MGVILAGDIGEVAGADAEHIDSNTQSTLDRVPNSAGAPTSVEVACSGNTIFDGLSYQNSYLKDLILAPYADRYEHHHHQVLRTHWNSWESSSCLVSSVDVWLYCCQMPTC